MKRMIVLFAAALMVVGLNSMVWAQPFTPTIQSDSYDPTPDAIPTPNEDNDNLSGVPNPADINDAVNLLLNTTYQHNGDVDFLRHVGPDSTWQDLSTADNSNIYTFISLTASNENSLRVYDVTAPAAKIDVFGQSFTGFGFQGDGTNANPFPAGISPFAAGSGINFGWNLESIGVDGTQEWDSNPANNPEKLDHMLTYHLGDLSGKTVWIKIGNNPPAQYTFNDPYLLAWEDRALQDNGLLGDEDFDDSIFLVDSVQPVPEPMTMMLLGSGLLGMAGLRRKRA